MISDTVVVLICIVSALLFLLFSDRENPPRPRLTAALIQLLKWMFIASFFAICFDAK